MTDHQKLLCTLVSEGASRGGRVTPFEVMAELYGLGDRYRSAMAAHPTLGPQPGRGALAPVLAGQTNASTAVRD
jgi:hypothetical protein